MFDLFLPTRVVGGENCVVQNAQRLRELGTRCLILSGSASAKKSGALADAVTALEGQGIAWRLFDQIGPNPLCSVCHAAGIAAREFGAQFLLGIGGGSPLDATKAAAIYAANPLLAPQDIFSMNHKTPPLPFALIGTTAGTGSEVTRISVLTQDSNGQKRSISGDGLYAKIAFADARYTASLPYSVTLSTALDALAHVLEGWVKPPMNDVGKLFGARALTLLWEGLTALRQSNCLPDAAGREKLYYASLYAGVIINLCGTSFCHPMGYVLTEDFDIPHGLACAVFLPALLERTKQFLPETYAEIAAVFAALPGEPAMQTIRQELVQMAQLPDVHMTQANIASYLQRWQINTPHNFAASPGGLTPKEAAGLLQGLFAH